ncbi:MAG TPA: FAD-dependent oxidoreductase, partial [Pirellulales bacterium]|nr:FAD-dependent oxidoreductase [Pirellulales bacterium]
MSIEHVQNLVIGSGVGGKLVAWTLAKKGQTTAVVERAMIGGSCPNVACLPSKNVIYSAKAGSPKFTHVSEDDFRIVLDNLSGGSRTRRDRLIPYCLFTDPELAHVGINETEAKAKNISYRVAKMPMANVFRALTMSATRGFVKALIGDDDRIL